MGSIFLLLLLLLLFNASLFSNTVIVAFEVMAAPSSHPASKNRSNLQAALLVASTTAAGTIAFGWAWHRLVRRRRQRRRNTENDRSSKQKDGNYGDRLDDPSCTDKIMDVADRSISFPWEPRGNTTTHVYPVVTTTSSSARADNDKELEFLASMTFAGGGLRAPNCLCCL